MGKLRPEYGGRRLDIKREKKKPVGGCLWHANNRTNSLFQNGGSGARDVTFESVLSFSLCLCSEFSEARGFGQAMKWGPPPRPASQKVGFVFSLILDSKPGQLLELWIK